jgi:hypothetical protein
MWKIFSVPCGSALYKFHCMRFEVLTALDVKITVMVDVTPSRLV